MNKTLLALMLSATVLALATTAGVARAAECGSEYAAMERAADNAMAACQDGGDLDTCTYFWGIFEGRAQAYEDCMLRDSTGPF